MTSAEIIAAAREIVAAGETGDCQTIDNRSWKYGLHMARELLRLAAERESVISSIDGVDLRDIDQRDNANPDQLRAKLLGAGIQLAEAKAALVEANPLIFNEKGTIDHDQPLSKIAKECADKILHLRDLHAEAIGTLEKRAIELAAVRQSLDAAHDWLTEAVGDYCKPTADEPIEMVAEKLRLRCESAVKRMTDAGRADVNIYTVEKLP